MNLSSVADKHHKAAIMIKASVRGNTFSEVLRVVEVDFAKAPISLHQVVLRATQVDLTVLETKHTEQNTY